jgi:hypothetical protein
MPVEPSTTVCDSCGKILSGEAQGKHCTSCETLISIDSNACPICGEKFSAQNNQTSSEMPLNNDEEAMISQLLTWTKGSQPQQQEDTLEDKKERENALHVLKSLTVGESEEATRERMDKIDKSGEKKDSAEILEKQLVKVGKPFEATLEQNMININQIEFGLAENRAQLRLLEGKTDPDSQDMKYRLNKQIKEMEDKKQSLIAYQSDILMMGGAYRRLLKEQQGELLKIEAELKKRVEAFRKELDRRKKQKEGIRKRQNALDKREEDLSHRFLDLKKRSNELVSMEEHLKNSHKEIKAKEEALIKWEEEIAASREVDAKAEAKDTATSDLTKEQWLAEHNKLQADLVNVRTGVVENEKRKIQNYSEEEIQKMEEDLKTKEDDLKLRQKELEDMKNTIAQKDEELNKLKGDKAEPAMDEDTRRILKILDDLLENLPEDIVDKFAKSNDYLLYEKVLDAYKI